MNTWKIGLLAVLLMAPVGFAQTAKKTLCDGAKCKQATFAKCLKICTGCKAKAPGDVKLCAKCAEAKKVCRVCLKKLTAEAVWVKIEAKPALQKGAKVAVFKGKLTKVKQLEGLVGISMRTYPYRLGKYDVFRHGAVDALDKLVGKEVELKGWLNNMELEGRKLNEIWPTAVRPAAAVADVLVKDLQAAPESAKINGENAFRIICRGLENHTDSLKGGVMLASHEHKEKLDPADLEVNRVWVLKGEEVCGADIPEKSRPAKNFRYVGIIDVPSKPKWKSGDSVTLVIRIKNTKTDKTWLLSKKDVLIKAPARPMPKNPGGVNPRRPGPMPKIPLRPMK